MTRKFALSIFKKKKFGLPPQINKNRCYDVPKRPVCLNPKAVSMVGLIVAAAAAAAAAVDIKDSLTLSWLRICCVNSFSDSKIC